jgi:hypothetical protein
VKELLPATNKHTARLHIQLVVPTALHDRWWGNLTSLGLVTLCSQKPYQ